MKAGFGDFVLDGIHGFEDNVGEELHGAGAMNGKALWLRIAKAVEDLTSTDGTGTRH